MSAQYTRLVFATLGVVAALGTASSVSGAPLLYVANGDGGGLSIVDSDGSTSLLTQFSAFGGQVHDSTGTLFAVTDGSQVSKVTATYGALPYVTGFDQPYGLAVDGADNLYVAEQANGDVKRISPTGAVTTYTSDTPGAYGLTFDASGNLFVSTQFAGQVFKVKPSGVVSTVATGLDAAMGLTVDDAGNLYVASGTTVTKVTPAGVTSTLASGFHDSVGIVFDGTGLYVSDFIDSTISTVSLTGTVAPFVNAIPHPAMISLVPEPATLVVLLASVPIGILKRRRHGA